MNFFQKERQYVSISLPLFDRLNQMRVRNASTVGGFLSLTVSILSLAVLPLASKRVQPVVFAISSLSSVNALTCFRTRDQQIAILFDHETLADQARQNATAEAYRTDSDQWITTNLYNPPIPIDQPNTTGDSESEFDYFDWNELSDATEYPHVAILNKTGGGKSTLAQWLAKNTGGKIIVLDPHYMPGSYESADIVAGIGRNVGESAESRQTVYDKKGNPVGEKGEPEIDYPDSNSSCTQVINWLHREMIKRYGDRSQGCSDFEPINLIMDEFSSYAKKEGVPQRFKELIREARKVGIRLYILIQGSQVADLGLEGSSDLRSNLTFIRLGKFAIEYAKMRLRNTKPNTVAYTEAERVVEALKAVKRCALIEEDIPASIPELS